MMSFGSALRKERTEAALTMGDVARAMGVSVSSVSDVEHGRRPPPSQDRLAALVAIFDNEVVERLTRLAAQVKQTFLLNGTSPAKIEAGAALERSWGHFSDEQTKLLAKFLRELEEQR